MKKMMAVLSATLLLWGCSDSNSKVEEESVKEEKIEVVEEKEETIVEEVEEEIEEIDEEVEEVEEIEYSREDRVFIAYVMMADAFSSTSEVEYDSSADMLTIFPTDERFTMEIFYMMMGHEENIRDWDVLVESLTELSSSVSGVVDEDIQIAILNPEDSERVLLLVQDGFVLYNFADDI